MPFEAEEGMSLTQILNVVLPRYGLPAEPACRCAGCESHRAIRLVQALYNKFGRSVDVIASNR